MEDLILEAFNNAYEQQQETDLGKNENLKPSLEVLRDILFTENCVACLTDILQGNGYERKSKVTMFVKAYQTKNFEDIKKYISLYYYKI